MLYIIKSTVILGILLAVYHLFLEKEKMHNFNRFYLLSGLVLAFVTPLITVGYIEVPTIGEAIDLVPQILDGGTLIQSTENGTLIKWSFILKSLYIIVALGFLLRFLINLLRLLFKSLNNKNIKFKEFTLVLIEEQVLPHTFFNYVFINKDDYQSDILEDQLFTHELTHAHQIHSLDIVLIELVQIVFWFNPLIPIYKKSIQLNHEFLADAQVIKMHGSIKDYQHLLVDKAGSNPTIHLASNFNFSITKKRLKMMTKNSDRWRMSLYAFCTIPLFICLLMLFGNKAYAQSSETKVQSTESVLDSDLKTATIVWKDEKGTRVYKSYDKLSTAQKSIIKNLIPPPPPPHEDQLNGTSRTIPMFPKNSILEYDALKNSLRLLKDGDGIIPPPPPAPPRPPNTTAPLPPTPPPAPAPPTVAPPPPPAPPALLDTAIDMANKGGLFAINGKMVNSDQAIALLKNLDNIATADIVNQDGKKVMRLRTKQ